MPMLDLDLEFEDEDDGKKKKVEAVTVDVDLEFHTTETEKTKAPPRAAPASAEAPARPTALRPADAQVKNISEARVLRPAPAEAPAPRSHGAHAMKAEPHHHEVSDNEVINSLKEDMRLLQIDSQVKLAVAEYKIEILSDVLSDMKLMDHQISQLLTRMSTKNPELKQEALMIKKILADFTTKKRK